MEPFLRWTIGGGVIRDLLLELQALAKVAQTPELAGDEVARREVASRLSDLEHLAREALLVAMRGSSWQWGEDLYTPHHGNLVTIADAVATIAFPDRPIIRNELINRDYLSSNVTSARRTLMRAMMEQEALPKLGYTDGFPPDYALYLSILKGLHQPTASGYYAFTTPAGTDQFADFWEKTTAWLEAQGATTVNLEALYAFWRKPPFGLRRGPMPILALAYFLAHRNALALYENNTFSPELTSAILDEWLAAPKRIAWRVVVANDESQKFLKLAAEALERFSGKHCEPTPLEVARTLVALVLQSPRWSQHSTSFTARTLKLKQTILKASDPIRLLADDLPQILDGTTAEENVAALTASLEEYLSAMPALLNHVRQVLFGALHVETAADGTLTAETLETLRARATAIKGLAGRLIEEAFIGRLEKFNNARFDVEGLISLACSKPAMQWMDADITAAETKLSELGFAFRQLEASAALRGRPANRRVLRIVSADGDGELDASIEIAGQKLEAAKALAQSLTTQLKGLDPDIVLAALADAGVALTRDKVNATEKEGDHR